jgi:hypothetical protein
MLVRMIGDSTYEEVQRLRGMGLIHTEAKGSTLELTTTRRFAEYFGISSTKPEEIRKFLEDKLGVKPTSPVSPPEASLVTPPSVPAAPPEAGPADEALSVDAAAMARDDPTEAPG